MAKIRAFTIAELMMVVFVIAVLSGIAFSVVGSAISRGKQTSCMTNFRQALVATQMYISDYDDNLMLARYTISDRRGVEDATWVQLLLPYTNSFDVFKCPEDYSDRPESKPIFDRDLLPPDTGSRYFEDSLRSNIGYNYLYLSPMYRPRGSNEYVPLARTYSQVARVSQTIFFVDSAWDLTRAGRPTGGGNYLVIPPCRFARRIEGTFDTFPIGGDVYIPRNQSWDQSSAGEFKSYGGSYPWHSGRMTVGLGDGAARSMSPRQLTAGCSVRNGWAGLINDEDSYLWDTGG